MSLVRKGVLHYLLDLILWISLTIGLFFYSPIASMIVSIIGITWMSVETRMLYLFCKYNS